MALRGELAKWDKAAELKRVNPLMWAFPASRSTLLEERDTARKDSRKKATFLSFRLNVPALDEEVALLTPDEWEHVLSRDPRRTAKGCPSWGSTSAAGGRGPQRLACGSRDGWRRWRLRPESRT